MHFHAIIFSAFYLFNSEYTIYFFWGFDEISLLRNLIIEFDFLTKNYPSFYSVLNEKNWGKKT